MLYVVYRFWALKLGWEYWCKFGLEGQEWLMDFGLKIMAWA